MTDQPTSDCNAPEPSPYIQGSLPADPAYLAWRARVSTDLLEAQERYIDDLLMMARDPYKAPEVKAPTLYNLRHMGIEPYDVHDPRVAEYITRALAEGDYNETELARLRQAIAVSAPAKREPS